LNYTGVFDAKLPDSSLGSHADADAPGEAISSSHPPSDAVIVPDAHLLFSGDLKRAGLDLILSDTERQFVVRDYFKSEKHPTLLSPDGASLSGDVVDAFTGHVNFAQAGAGAGAAQIIGTVVKLTGSATAIRNGVAVELNIGDKVHKGDVVQSGSDSALGISFIDGTAFSLSSNARMVLNDMVYDPNGSANSSLLSLVQGTISFVAGDTAKDGNMRVETPVATMGIRGTAVLVEISADNGPTKFSILVEPGGRSGSYTLTDKLTGLPIRTISQPGLVTFVSATGINQPVSVVESLKTSTDLLNEREVVKLVFSIAFPQFNFDDASPKSTKFAMGSSGNNLADIGKPSNETDGSAFDLTGVELRKGAGSKITGLDSHAAEMLFFLQQTAFSSDSSTLIEDSVSAHLALSATGTIILPNLGPDTNSVTIALKSSTSNAHLPGYTDNVSQIGTFTVGEITTGANNTATVGWSFTLPDDNPVLQSLAMGQTLTQIYTVTIRDNSGALVTQEVTVTLVGTNDLPTIVSSSTDTPTLTEDSVAASLNLTAAGTITFQDVDLIDTHTASIALKSSTSNVHLPGYVDNISQIGTFALTSGPSGVSEITTDTNDAATVSWSFTLADNDPVLQSLALGETITQIYTVTIKDNNGALLTQDVKVTLVGTNDAPIITSEDLCGAVIEQLTPACNLTDSGIISFTDVDLTDVHLVSAVGTPIGCVLGTLTAVKDNDTTGTGSGGQLTWTYTVADSAIGYLTKDQTKVESFTITLTDQNGSVITRQIDITITGANDAASITGTATGAVTEDCTLTTAGALTVSDVDAGENHFQTPLSLAATYGAFAFDPDTGVWCYALDNAGANVQALAACQVVHDTLTVKSADDTASQQIDVTITGSNDAASITGTATGAVTQDCTLTAAGTLTVCDIDSGENHFQTPLSLAATYGEFAFDPNTGVWGYTLDNAAANVQALAPCQVVHDTLTVKSADGTACQQIDVTITASDKPPAPVGDTNWTKEDTDTVMSGNEGVHAVALTENNFVFAQTPALDNAGTMMIDRPGTATIDGRGTLDFESVSTADVVFGSGTGGTLKLGDSFHFKGTISGFDGSDIIHLADLASTTVSISYLENAARTGGTLSISNSAQTVGLALPGDYSVDNFSIAPDQAKGSLIGYVPHDLIA
jgi:VCBS repeat-containing protein